MNQPAQTVQPIHFADFGGEQFERLVFAYHLRTGRWKSLEWYGQVGSDLGRDILGITETDSYSSQRICIQCVNRGTLTLKKATGDIDKAVKAKGGKPDVFRIICRSTVSATARDKIKAHATKRGIKQCEIWSGTEFEERLRANCESLLKRLIAGVVFPDSETELIRFAGEMAAADDKERLSLIARLFDRPAFHTPLRCESNVPAFKQAITDTIQALNTGIWQTRDGKEIGRIPTRFDFTDSGTRDKLQEIERRLAKLRSVYDQLLHSGDLRPCNCGKPDCPVFMLSPKAEQELTESRSKVLELFQAICPAFVAGPNW